MLYYSVFTSIFTSYAVHACQTYNMCNGIYYCGSIFKFPFKLQITSYQCTGMSFFTNSSGLTITGGNFTSISLPTEDAGRFYFHFKPHYLQYWTQPAQHKYWGKERTLIGVNLTIMLRLMTSGRGVGAGVWMDLWFVNKRPQWSYFTIMPSL